jgi:shikimate kinase
VGQIVARELGMPFIDTDTEIEALAKDSVRNIFARQGEAAFRKLEAIVSLRAAIAGGQVIATGGGALLNTATRELCPTADLATAN